MVRHGSFECNVFPCLECFDRLSNRWIVEVEETEWEEAHAIPINDSWEEVREPPNQDALEEVPAPPAQYAWQDAPATPEYHPGEGSSSQWGNDGASSDWAQWEKQGPYYDDGSYGWSGPKPRLPWLLASTQAWGSNLLSLISIVCCHASFVYVDWIVVLLVHNLENPKDFYFRFCMFFILAKSKNLKKYFCFCKALKKE
jgi:hypothetical protein